MARADDRRMLSKLVLSEPVKRLLARERAEALAELQRTHRRSLDDNPEGSALIEKILATSVGK